MAENKDFKAHIIEVLFGTAPANTLSQAEIDFAISNLPSSNTRGAHGPEKIDFTGFKFLHNTDSSNEAVGLTRKDIIALDRKIQDAVMENEEETSDYRRSRTIELLLPHLSMKEVIWLVDSGVLFIQERKKAAAIMSAIGLKGGPGGAKPPSITEEEDD